MATMIPNKPPSPSLPQLQSSLSSLATATHILDGFAHRNKNQHRSTKWWASFDMLRRSLHKILPDLEAAVQRAKAISSSALGGPSSKRRKTAAAGVGGPGVAAKGKLAKQPELDRVVERATWTRDVVNVRAYEAFTQLTADRQFAQLGLVLLGVLAQAGAALAPLAREEEPEPEPMSRPAAQDGDVDVRGEAVPREAVSEAVAGGGGGGGGGGGSGTLDLGVAVSRDELLLLDSSGSVGGGSGGEDDGRQRSAEHATPPLRETPPAREDGRDPENKRAKQRKKQEDVLEEAPLRTDEDVGSRPQPLPSAPKELKEPKKEKKVKKKRKKGGDEFDDLFSSLL